jgi:Fe2+ or Zn2+ uptake regulation protein
MIQSLNKSAGGDQMMSEGKQALDNWLEVLHEQGFRRSGAQEVIVDVLADAKRPLSAEEIWDETQRIRPETGRATVYRFIDKLRSAGLLRRVHGYRNCSTYVPSPDPRHMLFACIICGCADYLENAPLTRLIEDIETTSGHRITEGRLQLLGVCAACQSNGL